jgi:hypothetical protein
MVPQFCFCLMGLTLLLFVWLLGHLELAEPAATADCTNNFKLIPSGHIPYAYSLITNLFRNRSQIPSACQSIHPDAQIAIVRNNASFVYLQELMYNYSISGSSNFSWIGLDQTSKVNEPFGNWFWIDGQSCDNFNPTDGRCYNRLTSFNNFGNIEDCGAISSFPKSRTTFSDAPCNDSNPYFCEIPGKVFHFVHPFI